MLKCLGHFKFCFWEMHIIYSPSQRLYGVRFHKYLTALLHSTPPPMHSFMRQHKESIIQDKKRKAIRNINLCSNAIIITCKSICCTCACLVILVLQTNNCACWWVTCRSWGCVYADHRVRCHFGAYFGITLHLYLMSACSDHLFITVLFSRGTHRFVSQIILCMLIFAFFTSIDICSCSTILNVNSLLYNFQYNWGRVYMK